MTDQRFPRQVRICREIDFARVHRSKAFVADETLVLRGCRNGLGYSRLGISVSRKVGGAVVRNHWKRLIREAFRLTQSGIPSGLDVVVRPRRGAQPGFHQIRKSLPRLCQQLASRLGRDHV